MIGVNCFNVIKALVVRAALSLHTLLTVWRVTENLDDQMYWILCCLMVPFVLEGMYTIIRRKGREYLWFSPCFFLYLCSTLPPIWLLELDKSQRVRNEAEDNETLHGLDEQRNETIHIPVPIDLNPKMWTIVIEEMLLYLLVIGRWILPRGEVTREQLSELLFAFIGIAADVMEFFSLFGEDEVRKNRTLGYCLLSIWSLSILQFTMSVTVTQQPKRAKKIKVIEKVASKEEERKKVRNELFAIFVSMIMQDVPFLVLRLYTIITYNLVNYSLVFFTAKNALVISLLFYKVAVILQKAYCSDDEKKSKENGEKIRVGSFHGVEGGGGDGGCGNRKSAHVNYALDYETSGLDPREKQRPSNLTHDNGEGQVKHRKPSKTSSKSSASTRKSKGSKTGTKSPSSEEESSSSTNGYASPASSPVPNEDGVISAKSADTLPRSSENSQQDVDNRETTTTTDGDQQTAPRAEPEIFAPSTQDAQPGDPDFKPYVSVLKI